MKKVILGLVLILASIEAKDKVYSYTPIDMQRMASIYNIVVTNKLKLSKSNATFFLKASEFKGYISALLDFNEKFNECARFKDLNVIVVRSAILLDRENVDKAGNSAISALIAVETACNDSLWQGK